MAFAAERVACKGRRRRFLPELPHTAVGKLDRKTLKHHAAGEHASPA